MGCYTGRNPNSIKYKGALRLTVILFLETQILRTMLLHGICELNIYFVAGPKYLLQLTYLGINRFKQSVH